MEAPSAKSGNPMPLFWQAALFLVIFASLQYLWLESRQGEAGHIVIDQLTVKPAVWLINLLTPEISAHPQGTLIAASGGGINVINGCEGVEEMFLLAAAILIAPLRLRDKLYGLVVGSLLIFALNQIRLVGLFYALRYDKSLFSLLHGTVAPVLLIAFTLLFFALWLARHIPKPYTIKANAISD